jgi:hypothetical protein
MEDGKGEKGWRIEDGRWRMAREKRDGGSVEDRRLRMES